MFASRLTASLVVDVASGSLTAPRASPALASSSRGASLSGRGASSSTASSRRPTHFVALRLPDPELHTRLAALQGELTAGSRELARCAVPAVKTHLTAFVLHAPGETEVEAACDALAACAPLVETHFSERQLPRVSLRGLGSFGSRVLFCEIAAGDDRDRLARFVAATSEVFQARGLIDPGHDAWQPHVTVLKTSRAGGGGAPGHKQKIVKIPPALWREHADVDLGTHSLPSLQLCAMAGVGPDGYYKVVSDVPLG